MQRCRIETLEDIERIEARPYAEFMAHASLADALDDAAARHAERPALSFVQDADNPDATLRWSHAEFAAEVRRAANLFHALVAPAQPRVALLLPAIPQAYFALWGAELAGVACPLNYLLDAEHMAELVNASGANILVALAVSGPNSALDIWSRVQALRKRCPGLHHVLSVGPASDAIDFDAARRAQPGSSLNFARQVNADTVAALFHTGGTTGAPKLAQHTHGNQLHTAWSAAQLYAMSADDCIVNGFPLFHVAGSLVFGLSALLSGAHIVLPTLLGLRNPRMVARYWHVVDQHRATLLAAVPTVMATLLTVPVADADISSVRAVLTGGSPLPTELANAFEARLGIPVRNILGMTECAGVISIEPWLAPRTAGSCGLRLPFTTVEAVASDGAGLLGSCGPAKSGVLRLRGPNVGPGYTDTAKNAGTFSADGRLSTGDIGHVDAHGRIFVTGRAKDLIIRSAHNIDPGMVEEALMRHPAVALAAAVGEPDEYAGEVPVAFVQLKPGAVADPTKLLAHARAHIAEPPAMPKRITIVDHLPLTAIGKVYKPALRLLACERAIAERLAARAMAPPVQVQAIDTGGGLVLEMSCYGQSPSDAHRAAVSATMAPFALSWRWADPDE